MTYDRYLLKALTFTFIVCFITTFGLFIVIDLFENIDELVEINGNRGLSSLLGLITTLYGYRSILFLDQAGPVLIILSVMTVLIVLQRSGELHPLLAAGISMYRILRPVIIGSVVFNGILMLNQELLVPRVAFLEHELRHRNNPGKTSVQPMTDHATMITIDGDRIHVPKQTIDKPVIVLPQPTLVHDITVLEAQSAVFLPATHGTPSGWLLQHVSASAFAEISHKLTKSGREMVQVRENEKEIFVVSAVTCDQLLNRTSSFTSLSTADLIARIRCPAFGEVSIHRLVRYLHSRMMQPYINIIAVLLIIPLMVRRESRGLVMDSTLSGLVLTGMFGLIQTFQGLGAIELISPEFAACGPVVIGGAFSAWLSAIIRT